MNLNLLARDAIMMTQRCYSIGLTILFAAVSTAATMRLNAQDAAEAIVGYDQVQPVLRKRCVTCHNIDETRGDLDLSSLTTTLVGSNAGPVVVAGKPLESTLYTLSAHLSEPAMPPNSAKIPARELDIIRRWIEGMGVEQKPTSVDPVESTQQRMATTVTPDPAPSLTGESGWVPIKPLMRQTSIAAFAIHPSEPLIAVSGNGQIVIGNLESSDWGDSLDFPAGQVSKLKFMKDGKTLIAAGGVGGLSGTVIGYDLKTGIKRFQLADEVDSILALDMSGDGKLVAVGGPTKVVRVYSTESGEPTFSLRNHTDWILSVSFSPDGLLLATADRFGGVFVWNAASGELFHPLLGHQGPVRSLHWSDSGELLTTSCEDGKLRVWEMHHGKLVSERVAGVAGVLSFDQHSTGPSIAAGRNGKVTSWNDSYQPLGELALKEQIDHLAFSSDGRSFVLADASGNLSVCVFDEMKVVKQMVMPTDNVRLQTLLTNLKSREMVETNLPESIDLNDALASELNELKATIAMLNSRVELIERNSARLKSMQTVIDKGRELRDLVNTDDFDDESRSLLDSFLSHAEAQVEATKKSLEPKSSESKSSVSKGR